MPVILTFAVFFLLFSPILAQEKPKPIALIVGVSAYPESSGWDNLSSENDLDLVYKTLIARGISEEQIFVLKDDRATREGILDAIENELLASAEPGSAVYFHFSGHGQQIFDQNGDELDGYDEAIVPINSPQQYRPGIYEGENLIRDEELGDLFDQIRAKIGPEGVLQVVIDACHSGTGTRGIAVARGTDIKMAPKDYRVPANPAGKEKNQFATPEVKTSAMAPIVAFFGSAHNQLNFETTDENGHNIGSLTYAYCNAMSKVSAETTYRGLFDQILLKMNAIAPRQMPQAEGDLDVVVMSGQLAPKADHFKVKQWNDPGSVTINAGWLQGIHEGTVVNFFPTETRLPGSKEPVNTGTVISSNPTSSIVEVLDDIGQDQAMGLWVFVDRVSIPKIASTVEILLQEGHPILPTLDSFFNHYNISAGNTNPDVSISTDGRMVILSTHDDIVLGQFEITENISDYKKEEIADDISLRILGFRHTVFLKQLELSSSKLPVSFEIIPLEYDRSTNTIVKEIPLRDKIDDNGRLILNEGDVLRIKVRNDGVVPAYFSLVDFMPDFNYTVLFPGPTETPAEYMVPPGRELELPQLIEIYPPYGLEVFKLVACDKPIDLRPGVRTRGTKGSGPQPVEELFVPDHLNGSISTRGAKMRPIGATEVNISSIIFEIAPKY